MGLPDGDAAPKVKVYRVTSRTSGKSYIGITTEAVASRWRKHLTAAESGSRYLFHKAIRKYGPDDFEVEVLAVADGWANACDLEVSLIVEHGTFAPGGYNSTKGGEGAWGHVVSTEARLDIGRKVRAKYSEEAFRRNHRAGQKRRFSTQEGRAAHSEAVALFWRDDEARRAQSAKLMAYYTAGGQPANKGKSASPETRARLSLSLKAFYDAGGTVWNKGGSFSPESREKMSASRKRYVAEGGKPTNSRPVVVNGVRYETMRVAAVALGLTYKNLTNRFYRRWPGYEFADEDPA